MSSGLETLFGALGAAGVVIAVVGPMVRAQGKELGAFLAGLRADVEAIRADVAELHRDMQTIGERVARIEGAREVQDQIRLLYQTRETRPPVAGAC